MIHIKKRKKSIPLPSTGIYEYCTNCGADLTRQSGFSNDLDFWVCRGCNRLLINPDSSILGDSGIAWVCDGCGAFMNCQPGFDEKADTWKCTRCGHENKISGGEVYLDEADFTREKADPTRGLTDREILSLSCYSEIKTLGGKKNIFLVKDPATGLLYVKKVLDIFDEDVIRLLQKNPVEGMPGIVEIFRSERFLIIIEEYIEGVTLKESLESGPFSEDKVKEIMLGLCSIVEKLHSFEPPVIHRDIKPGNIMLTKDGHVFLLDINGARVSKPDRSEDTVLFGTREYAAPEQYGFGTSSPRTDIYAMGVLLNVLLTGKLPKDQMVEGVWGDITRKCTRMDPEDRYSCVGELAEAIKAI